MLFKRRRKAELREEPVSASVPAPPAPPRVPPDRALIDALTESRRRFKDIVEISGDFAWETDAEGKFVFVSLGLSLGYRPDELVGKHATGFLAEDRTVDGDTPFLTRSRVRDVDIWMRGRDGAEICLNTSAIPFQSDDGEWLGARGVCRNVTEERAQQAAFAAWQQREAAMARIAAAASSEVDPDAMLASAVSEMKQVLDAHHVDIRRPAGDGGFEILAAGSEGAANDAPVLGTVFGRVADSATLVTAADAENYYLCAPAVYREEVLGALLMIRTLESGTFSDDDRRFCDELATQMAILLAQVDSHRQLEQMARTDEMTGLLNRRAFMAELSDRTARAGDHGSDGTLFYVDLDNFKAVNDVHGHQRGDEALIALADLLISKTRPGDLVARLGGDEFAMWLDRTDRKSAKKRAEDLLDESTGLRIYSGSTDKPLGISVGVAVFKGGSTETADSLTARADGAMYEIKHGGKSGFVVASAYRQKPEAGANEKPAEKRATA